MTCVFDRSAVDWIGELLKRARIEWPKQPTSEAIWAEHIRADLTEAYILYIDKTIYEDKRKLLAQEVAALENVARAARSMVAALKQKMIFDTQAILMSELDDSWPPPARIDNITEKIRFPELEMEPRRLVVLRGELELWEEAAQRAAVQAAADIKASDAGRTDAVTPYMRLIAQWLPQIYTAHWERFCGISRETKGGDSEGLRFVVEAARYFFPEKNDLTPNSVAKIIQRFRSQCSTNRDAASRGLYDSISYFPASLSKHISKLPHDERVRVQRMNANRLCKDV